MKEVVALLKSPFALMLFCKGSEVKRTVENPEPTLRAACYRTDGGQHNLRSAAYEALMEMVKNSPKDCYVTVQKTTMVILERLQKVIQMEVRACCVIAAPHHRISVAQLNLCCET